MPSSSELSIKICGMRDPQNIEEVASLAPDMMGFIFYPPSKRYVGENFPQELVLRLPSSITRVGVVVNASIDEMLTIVEAYHLDVLQLHGDEKPDVLRALLQVYPSLRLWKAFGIKESSDLAACAQYVGLVEHMLFDTKTKGYGGSGRTFDWSLLQSYPQTLGLSEAANEPESMHPSPGFLLSGGLGLDNLSEVIEFVEATPHCVGVDVNSRVEISPGLKSVEQVKQLIHTLRGEA